MIILKTRREIAQMRRAGQLTVAALQLAKRMVKPGVTTGQIDRAIGELFDAAGAVPVFRGVSGKRPFPAVSCICVDEQVVHAIPGNRTLKNGDLVTIDTGCRWNGWCSDAAWTYAVGTIDSLKRKLLEAGQETLNWAVKELRQCDMWSEVAERLEKRARGTGFQVLRDLKGHGIGQELHEDPQVVHCTTHGSIEHDFALEPGLVFTIEPILISGTDRLRILADGWTVVTADKQPCVHFEHTVAITDQGPEVLTAAGDDDTWDCDWLPHPDATEPMLN